jgi:hypothetical protein
VTDVASMDYLVKARIPTGVGSCAFSFDSLSLAERNARLLISAGSRRVDIYDSASNRNLLIRSYEEIRRDMIEQDELPPVTIDLWPLPETAEARAIGCLCHAIRARRGKDPIYEIAHGCPVHSR